MECVQCRYISCLIVYLLYAVLWSISYFVQTKLNLYIRGNSSVVTVYYFGRRWLVRKMTRDPRNIVFMCCVSYAHIVVFWSQNFPSSLNGVFPVTHSEAVGYWFLCWQLGSVVMALCASAKLHFSKWDGFPLKSIPSCYFTIYLVSAWAVFAMVLATA